METYLILGIGLIVVIIFLLHDNNWKGCILYVITIVFAFAFYYIAEHFKKPAYECREEVESPCDKFFRFSHSRYLCPSGGHHIVLKRETIKGLQVLTPVSIAEDYSGNILMTQLRKKKEERPTHGTNTQKQL